MDNLRNSLVLLQPTPADAKLCNWYVLGGNVVVETIAQYLARVPVKHRSPDAQVTMQLPKAGYTSLGTYTVAEFKGGILANFEGHYYTFVGGLADENFVEIPGAHPPVTIAPESINEMVIGSDQVLHLKKKDLSYADFGTITWLHDYTFRFSVYKFHLQGNYFSVETHDVTLAAADATYDRWDTFYAEGTPATDVITGVPSADPVATELDPLTQLFLQNVLVKAGSTSPETITDEVIYDENIEWTTNTEAALYGATVDFEDTNTPNHGAVQTRVTFAANRFDHVIISYTKDINVDITNSNLIIPVRTSRAFGATEGIYLRIKDATTNVGTEIIIKDGKYGFNSSVTTFHELTIPFADFKPTKNLINVLWIGFINGGAGVAETTTIDFDYIRIQKGIAPVDFTEVDPIFNKWLAENWPITKEIIEAVLTGVITSHTHTASWAGLPDYQEFEFQNVVAGAQSWDLHIKPTFGYTIESISLETDSGTITGVSVLINATTITGLSGITVDTAVDTTSSTALKTVVAGDRITLAKTGESGVPTLIKGQINYIRT